MKQILMLCIVAALIFIFSGKPTNKELTQSLDKMGQFITNESFVKANEEVSKFNDEWAYLYSKYKKEDAEEVEKFVESLENSLAVSNKKKSEKGWRQLKDQWEKMNS